MANAPARIEEAKPKSLVTKFASRYSVEAEKLLTTLKATAFKQSGNDQITNEQMMALLVVADQYKLNPFTKEIYAFPSRGGIQPIVSIDGWLNIINSHPEFDGMQFEDQAENGVLVSVTCKMFRKDRTHPVEVTEYMSECKRDTDTWKKYPARMLRHKATIQAARYAFGFSGIVDPDEGERIIEAGKAEVVEPVATILPECPADHFDANFETWSKLIHDGKKSAQDIINMVSNKYTLTDRQKSRIIDVEIAATDERNEGGNDAGH